MCKVTHYMCDCCEVLFDRLWSKCHYDPRNIYECRNLDERVSRAMYCESCDEAFRFKQLGWYRYLADPHRLITKWGEFKARLEALTKAIIEQREYKAQQEALDKAQRKDLKKLEALGKAQRVILERAQLKAFEKEMIERREYKAYLESLDKDQLEALEQARLEAREKAREKEIIDQRKFNALLEEFNKGE
ncbi:unnamed protein product [Fusarium equiseti]|uniref:Uncharacterized protein n=1 Tax=Fusarium equiseti TaxID=61235 RepID=A0A8J2NBG2_FUSEQ|nr:unnamed protein product [Fusarium equiseti]